MGATIVLGWIVVAIIVAPFVGRALKRSRHKIESYDRKAQSDAHQ